jgi:hypothetical protein
VTARTSGKGTLPLSTALESGENKAIASGLFDHAAGVGSHSCFIDNVTITHIK